jgi:hypothetical protein
MLLRQTARLMSAPRAALQRATFASASAAEPITETEVFELQKKWSEAIRTISQAYLQNPKAKEYVNVAANAAGELYGYGHSKVLFKPTRATANPFRPTPKSALSYFVGAEAVGDTKYQGEDTGFAINGGRGWKSVEFKNHDVDLAGPVAVAMGEYVFTCATTDQKSTVQYTFGYKRNDDGKARIFLHHSSVPFQNA